MRKSLNFVVLVALALACAASMPSKGSVLMSIQEKGRVRAPELSKHRGWLNTDRPLTLTALRGKVVLLDFWATSCAPCVKALPRLAALHAQHAAKGFELVSIAMPSDDLPAFLKQHPPGGGIHAIDDDDAAQSIYRIDRFPNYWLIARDGTILCAHCKLDDVEQQLPALLR